MSYSSERKRYARRRTSTMPPPCYRVKAHTIVQGGAYTLWPEEVHVTVLHVAVDGSLMVLMPDGQHFLVDPSSLGKYARGRYNGRLAVAI